MDYSTMTTRALLDALRKLAASERRSKADFMACLAEADRREQAVIAEGYASLYDFCVRDLKLAESTAYQRVKVARLCHKRPDVLSYLKAGETNVSNLALIVAHAEEHPELIEKIKGKRKREVEILLTSVSVQRQIPDRIRLLPPAPAAVAAAPSLFEPEPAPSPARTTVAASPAPKPPEAYRAEFRFVASARFAAAVERLRALLWHKHPAGGLEDVLFAAIEEYLRRHDPVVDRRPTAACAPPADPRSRHVPAAVAREIWRRDGGRCAYQGDSGRCPETRGLELDHIVPWALGGPSDDPSNLRLLCAAHNQSERERIFGPDCTRVQSGG